MGTLKQDLLELGLELRETHISLVFLSPTAVYKVKKPVELGFLDFSTLERRREACEAEVALNSRLAPSVYLGVVPIALDAGGRHRLGAAGEPVEWAVEMRRLNDADAADRRLREARLGRTELGLIASRLADFHARARSDAETASFGSIAAIENNVRENFEQTRQSAPSHLSERELATVEAYQLGFLREHRARFEARVAQGRVRDGHGDLRLEHCYLDAEGGVEIIDCIEFNQRFRYGDVAADLAFLAMDLAWHERVELGEALLAEYARASRDYDLYGVVDFYLSYRAYVRAKVSSMLESDKGIDPAARARAAADARKYYLLAEACARPPLAKPALYLVGGVIASGKSSVSDRLAALVDAPVVDADRVRKQLAGVSPLTRLDDPAFAGHYSAETSERVYAELLRRAGVVLDSGRSVVVDASFRSAAQRRAAFELAERRGLPCLFIECAPPLEVCRQRLAERALERAISDGRAEIFDAFVASFEPVKELRPGSWLRLDTSRPLSETMDAIAARLA